MIDRRVAAVETLSKGEIDVRVFGADSLVGEKETIVSVAGGEIECAFSVRFRRGGTLQVMTVTTRPFVFRDMKIWRDRDGSDAANVLGEAPRRKGLENVVRLFQTNDAALSSNGDFLIGPEDVRGEKPRGLAPAFDEVLGAAPVSTPGGEVRQAPAARVIDAAMTGAAVSRECCEVQDHFSVVPVISVRFHGDASPNFYAGLSGQARAALDAAGKEAAEAPAALRAEGVQLHVLAEAQNAAREAVARSAFDAKFRAEDEDEDEDEDAATLPGRIDKLRSGS